MSGISYLSVRWPGLSLLALIFCFPVLQETTARRLVTFTYITFVTLAMGRTMLGRADLKMMKKKTHSPASSSSSSPLTVKKQHPTITALEIEDTTCLICQEPVGTRKPEGITETWSMLPCGHAFGSHCIKHYLAVAADTQPLCPICRHLAYHDPCGHPVLPFLLRPDGTHPDLVVTDPASGKVRPPTAEADLLAVACAYCQELEGKRRRKRERQQQMEDAKMMATIGRMRRPLLHWLRDLMPFGRRKREAELSDATLSGDSDDDDTDSEHARRLTRQEARTRRRTQATTNGVWNGPWVDVPTRDVDWEKWWSKQAPRAA